MRIGDLDTEDPPGLRALKRMVRNMTKLAEIDEMLGKLPIKSRTRNEKDLAEVLDIQRALLSMPEPRSARREARRTAAETEQAAPRKEEHQSASVSASPQQATTVQPDQRAREPEGLAGIDFGTLEVDMALTAEQNLLIGRVFSKALAQLAGHPDDRVTALLKYLKQLKEGQETGPWVTLKGNANAYGVRGEASENAIELAFPLPLLREDKLDDLVLETAKSFVHEAAHLRQLRIYENVSHPFGIPRQIVTFTSGDDLGIPQREWPREVKDAHQELQNGGEKGQAKDNIEWVRIIGGLENAEYYVKGGKDMRARELVSHLMEIVYTWRAPEQFDAVFPRCAALLKRVIIEEAEVKV